MKSISAITRPPGVDGRLYELDAEKEDADEFRAEGSPISYRKFSFLA